MAKKNSKIKGKIGELEASRVLGEILGITLRRSQQVKGTADSADIEPTDFDWKLHPEIKPQTPDADFYRRPMVPLRHRFLCP